MLLKRLRIVCGAFALSLFGVLGSHTIASAAAVTCGDLTLGIRTVTVDPGLVGGYCFATNGNLADNLNPEGSSLLDKDTTSQFPTGDPSESALQFTRTDGQSGGWSFAESLWDDNSRLFLGFHFGQAGECSDNPNDPQGPPGQTCTVDPDSFVVELPARAASGTYALGPASASLNALSNIYLWGVACTDPNGCNPPGPGPGPGVPEPASLALLGIGGLAAAGALRRRRKQG